MIQSIGISGAKPANITNNLQKNKVALPKLGHDTFEKSSAISFGNLTPQEEEFGDLSLKLFRRHSIAEKLESEGLPERAEPFYIKNFQEIDKFVRSQKGKIDEVDIIWGYGEAMNRIAANLGVQAILTTEEGGSEEEFRAILARGKSYLKRGLDTIQKHFDSNFYNKDLLSHYNEAIEADDMPVHRRTRSGKLLIEEVHLHRERNRHLAQPANSQERCLSHREIDRARARLTREINATLPDKKTETTIDQLERFVDEFYVGKDYSIETADMIEKYKSLSLKSANNHLNQSNPIFAEKIMEDTFSLLQRKDPNNLYWEDSDFEIMHARIAERNRKNRVEFTDEKAVDKLVNSTKGEQPPVQKQLQELEKLQKTPEYLRAMTFFLFGDANDKNASNLAKYAVNLLGQNKDRDSAHQLRIIARKHPIAEVKEFAKSLWLQAKALK